MAIHLEPAQTSNYLDVAEVVALLRGRFTVVVRDTQQGIAAIATHIRERNPSASQAELDSLLEPLTESSIVIVADDPRSDTHFLRSLVVPNQPILLDWVYPDHQLNCVALVQRYADAIGYVVKGPHSEA